MNKGDYQKWKSDLIKINAQDAKFYTQEEFDLIKAQFRKLLAEDSAKYNEKI